MPNEDDSDVDSERSGKGSFRKLWEMLMQWATPSTVQIVCQCRHVHVERQCDLPPVDDASCDNNDQSQDKNSRNTIDVGASRRAGIMNMIRMNISRSLTELKAQLIMTDRRSVEKSLANLVNTFDCSGPAADFDMKLWRGMATILIVIVYPVVDGGVYDDDVQLPPSIANLGLLPDEYRYLTQRALVDLNES
jgi:hypothetical protein